MVLLYDASTLNLIVLSAFGSSGLTPSSLLHPAKSDMPAINISKFKDFVFIIQIFTVQIKN